MGDVDGSKRQITIISKQLNINYLTSAYQYIRCISPPYTPHAQADVFKTFRLYPFTFRLNEVISQSLRKEDEIWII
ncbi:hypothetical protein GCM10028827_25520 [Mucilaginibacter myungsuensis]